MRNAIPSFVAFSALAAACGGEDPPQLVDAPTVKEDAAPKEDAPVDAPQQLDLTCASNPAPTTANAQVTLSGAASSVDFNIVQMAPQFTPLPEADVDACQGDCTGGNLLDSSESAAAPCPNTGCAFTTAALATGGEPLDGYLTISKAGAGVRTTNIFPAEPIRADLANIPGLVFTNNAFNLLNQLASANQNDQENGVLTVVVTDCALTPVSGATLTVTQNGNAIPGATVFDAGAFVDQLAGTFFVFNVPAGEVTVGATVQGTTFHSHAIQSFAGQTSATQVTPGFAP
jgi:hypothetical protein